MKQGMNRRKFLSVLGSGAAAMCLTSACSMRPAKINKKPNVLFIAVDDLNDWIGCMGGHPQAKTPNIDRLAKRGVLFSNAHCQGPICGPSRASLMAGLLPSTTGQYNNSPHFRKGARLKDAITLTQHFSDNGYKTFGVGKIFHGGHQDPQSFDVNGPRLGHGPLPKEKLVYPTGSKLWDWGIYPDSDEKTHDHQSATWAIEKLNQRHETPFFLAVGFYRPHVPMYATKKWFDMYPLETIQLPKVLLNDRDDISEFAQELARDYSAPPHQWFIENNQWKHAVQSYLACVSFIDYQVGRLLNALEDNKLADNTIIVLFSDHGWHLGEKQRWAKRSLWQRSTCSPLIISAPALARESQCSQPVGLIDLYPTLVELCGIEPKTDIEGRSIVPLLKNPAMKWEYPAITTFEQNNHAVSSERWRYIRYADGSEELYDNSTDPHEWYNLAHDPEYADVVKQHVRWLPKINVPPL